jgi:HAD superfamily hydrolase (TIGR01509 family)
MALPGTPVKALLFDFDGVLADTEPLHWRAWREVVRPFGIDLDWEIFQSTCVGVTDSAMLHRLCALATKPVNMDELRAQYPQKRKLFHDLVDGRALISPELVAMLKSLTGLRLGVVTSSNLAEIEPILKKEQLLQVLGTVVYGNDVRHHKPDPEPYLIAMERLGVAAWESIVFEDSAAGLESARSAGCRVVQVSDVARVPALIRAQVGEIFAGRRDSL